MCTVIYEFSESKLLLCPKNENTNLNVSNTSANNNTEQSNTTVQQQNDSQVPSPAPSLLTPSPLTPAPLTPSPLTPSPLTPSLLTPSPLTPSPLTPSPLTPSPLTPSTRPNLRNNCECDCKLSHSEQLTPTPSNSSYNNPMENHTDTMRDVEAGPNLHWLHVLWCLPIFFVMYICYRRHFCSSIQVGIALRRKKYEIRSKSWPRHSRQSHPASAKRSKSESFDTVVL